MSELVNAGEHPTVYDPISSSPDAAKEKFELYKKNHTNSIDNNEPFWDEKAKSLLDWFSPYTSVCGGNFLTGDISECVSKFVFVWS